ncbi:MAG: type VI secretion system tube protein Hcp [Verrucomicrobia bacterium]|nr:type VI secretion system tube protein Hcp [Verrucomicrobiota bacterium]
MALTAYLKLSGSKQGEITGSVTQRGREGQILVIAANHEVAYSKDFATGLPTGKRQHKPFSITKEVDKSSPFLYQAMINNEDFKIWELRFWTSLASGMEEQYYTVKLTDALIADLVFHMPNSRNPDLSKYPEYEEVSFTYKKIQWLWTDNNLSAQDDWGIFIGK